MSSRYLNCVAVLVSVSLHLLDHRLYTKAATVYSRAYKFVRNAQTKHSSEHLCFVHPILRFWFLVTLGNKVSKILRNLSLHFARQDEQEGNHATKVTKITKTKRQKYGINKTLFD